MQGLFGFVSCLTQMTATLWPLLISLSFNPFHPFSTRQSSSIPPSYLLLRPGTSRQRGSLPASTGGDWSTALLRLSEEQTSLYSYTPPLSLFIHPCLPPQGWEIIRPTVLLPSVIASLLFFFFFKYILTLVKLGGNYFFF